MPYEHDDSHILRIIDELGPLPDRLFSQWDRSHLYFRSNGEQFNSMVDEPRIELFKGVSFATRFRGEKACEIDDKEEELLAYGLESNSIQASSGRVSIQPLCILDQIRASNLQFCSLHSMLLYIYSERV